MDIACAMPDPWFQLTEEERTRRGKIDTDVCVMDDSNFFIRGCLEIPVIEVDKKFVWGVWVSVSKRSYDRILELWDVPAIEDEPPFFAWLCNDISIYPPTYGLKANLHLRSGGTRPLVELEPTEHPLALEQRQGISIERVQEIVAASSGEH
jgi:hypothetical protein